MQNTKQSADNSKEAQWVEKFRNSKTFGRGSCTTVDEAMTDLELFEAMHDFDSFEEAWNMFVAVEETHWERCGISWSPQDES